MKFDSLEEATRGLKPSFLGRFKTVESKRGTDLPLVSISANANQGHGRGSIMYSRKMLNMLDTEFITIGVNDTKVAFIEAKRTTPSSYSFPTQEKPFAGSLPYDLRLFLKKQPNLDIENNRYRFEAEKGEEDGTHYLLIDLAHPFSVTPYKEAKHV